MQKEHKENILKAVREVLPNVIAVYLFGSEAREETHSGSDVDIAILNAISITGDEGLSLRTRLANTLAKDIDIVDMKNADCVTNIQVLETGDLFFVSDQPSLDRFECVVMAKYVQLNLERREILDDVKKSGRIHA